MDSKTKNELRKKSKSLSPIIRIGKNGLTDGILKEIRQHLKIRKLIKIKYLKNSELDKDNAAEKITKECNCILIDKIGLTMSFYKQ